MATKRIQKNRKNESGTYDVIHYETEAGLVLMPDGSTIEEVVSDAVTASGGGVMTLPEDLGEGPYTIEFTSEDEESLNASSVAFSDTVTGIGATDVQTALEFLHDKVQDAVSVAIQDTTPPDDSVLWVDTSEEGGDDESASSEALNKAIDEHGITVSSEEPETALIWLDTNDSGDSEADVTNTGVQMVKLWENPNPEAEFAEQTITGNFDGYDMYVIICNYDKNLNPLPANLTTLDGTAYSHLTGMTVYQTGWINMTRRVQREGNSIIFSDNVQYQTDSYSIANHRNIPVQIYGIKGVQ